MLPKTPLFPGQTIAEAMEEDARFVQDFFRGMGIVGLGITLLIVVVLIVA